MSLWKTCFRRSVFAAGCGLWVVLALGGPSARAADQQSKPQSAHDISDIVEVVDQAVGEVPHGEESHAIDYHQPPLEVEWPLFLYTLVLFAAFVLVMRSAVWTPLLTGLNAREDRIVRAEKEARAARLEAEQLANRAEERLAEVYGEVKAIIAKARAEAETQKQEIISKAEADSQRIKEEALAAIDEARRSAMAELEGTVEEQVSLATSQIAGRSL